MSSGLQALGIIMDGNRRWARERGLPSVEGHRRGFEKLKEVISWAHKAEISEVTVYAFSTENWRRSKEEVSYLMDLFRAAMTNELRDLAKSVRVRFIGDRSRLPEDLQSAMSSLESSVNNDAQITVVIALSYGGQDEVLAAIQCAANDGVVPQNKEELKQYMWSRGLRDPDLIIRTGGDNRLSNFLTFQSAYSELYFTNTKWPDFSENEFGDIVTSFNARERRFGS